MKNVVIVRIDLDEYSLEGLESLIYDGVITLAEASMSCSVEVLSEYDKLMWVRRVLRGGVSVKAS